jgi:class 3 adenylate cyclase/tetratricopeptide (TPR) repeat protein
LQTSAERSDRLVPYVPRLVVGWLREDPEATFREMEGSIAFVDISGFTKLSEKLARKGKVGAEVLTEKLGTTFAELLTVAYENGGGLVKFGGDALLLWFSGAEHQARASRAAMGMRRILRGMGPLDQAAGNVRLRMSVGIHSDTFHFFLAGESHRELIITGPAATTTVLMETLANAGEIVISGGTAEALPKWSWGNERGPGRLLRSEPPASPGDLAVADVAVDISSAVPLAIREYLAGTNEPEHRQVTVAFIHFSGADAFIERSGPAALAKGLDEMVSAVQRAAVSHEVAFLGTDIASDGGKIILAAGAPLATGDHEERMLLTLREIVEGDPVLPVRIGVHRGHVFAGDVGPHYRRTYTVMGDTVNLSARLMAAAATGQILVTEEVTARSRTRFEMTPLEPFMVKGKSRPVQAYAVGQVVAGQHDELAAEDLPLIGREEEQKVLLASLESAVGRSGMVVELVGQAGVGKSRLVEELRKHAEGVTVLSVSCDLYESSAPFSLFRQLVRGVLDIRHGDDPVLVEERLRGRVQADAPELVPWLPLLGAPLDLPMAPTAQTAALEGRFRQTKLAELTSRFLALALPTATLIVVEDAQWMDDASAELLRILAADVHDRPWLVLITRRDSTSGFVLPEGPGSESLEVGPLGAEDSIALAEVMTEASPLAPHVIASLAERSGGNPLFLRELLAAARAGGIELFPDAVEDLIMARIDLLAPADRALLREAAVLGVSFSEELLSAVVRESLPSPDDDIWQRLGHFLERESEGEFRFRQSLIRDAAYEGLSYRKRRDLHARVGEVILRAAQNPEEQSALLALHFFHAGRHRDAWRFGRVAGDRARAAYANVEAAQQYRQALEAARVVPDASTEQLAEVQEALGDVCDRLGEYRGAEKAYRSARRLLGATPIAAARLLLKEAGIPERVGRYSQALRSISRGHSVLEGVEGEDAARERARLSAAYSSIRQAQGRHAEAVRWCRRAISEAESAGDRDALAYAYAILSWAYASIGHPDSGRYSHMALEIYEELGNLGRQALVLNYLGAFAYFDGKWDEAIEYYERGREARERTGDAVTAAYGTINIGEILSDQGRLQEAEVSIRAALRVWRAAGYRFGIGAAQSLLGRVASRAGRCDEALTMFAQARETFVDVGDRASVLETDVRIAECRLLRGERDLALELIADALARAEEAGGVSVHTPALYRMRGEALLREGDIDRGRAALEASLGFGRQRKAEYEVALTLRLLAHLERREDLASESRSILDRLGVISVPGLPLRKEVALS